MALVPALILAVCDWIAVATGKKKLEYVFKPLTLVALIVVAVVARPERPPADVIVFIDTRVWAFIVAALVFSLIGDLFLMLPSDKFLQGLAAFFVAHVCYIVAFADSFGAYRTYAVAVAVVAVGALLYLRVRRGIIEKGQRELLVPVTLYVIAISVMVVAAVGTFFTHVIGAEGFMGILIHEPAWHEKAATAAAVGAVLFYISDALIGWTRFVKDFKNSRLAIMVTYHLGQMGFVLYLLRS